LNPPPPGIAVAGLGVITVRDVEMPGERSGFAKGAAIGEGAGAGFGTVFEAACTTRETDVETVGDRRAVAGAKRLATLDRDAPTLESKSLDRSNATRPKPSPRKARSKDAGVIGRLNVRAR